MLRLDEHRMPANRRVALTFDDGPHPKNTARLIDILSRRIVPATFFFLGKNISLRPHIAKLASDAGHEIGNHGWSHSSFESLDNATILRELKETNRIISEVSSQACEIYRPPFGQITQAQQSLITQNLGYKLILWDIDSLDWQKPSGETLIRNTTTTIGVQTTRLLFHDFADITVETLPCIVDTLLDLNCTFYTVSRLLELKGTPESYRD
jgi:peptidoglycan-N-acetylglucosamine deacetylase